MRIIGWFSKILVSAILISIVSVVTTGYLVNSYITQLLKPYNIELPTNSFNISDFLVNLRGGSNILDQAESNLTVGVESTISGTNINKSSISDDEDAVAAWSQSGSQSSQNRQQQALVMSEEQFLTRKEQLSDEDKTIIFSALSRLPQDDMQTISVLLEDGLTSLELIEVEKIVVKHLKPEEYNKLLGILNKSAS